MIVQLFLIYNAQLRISTKALLPIKSSGIGSAKC